MAIADHIEEIRSRYVSGETLAELGFAFGVSRERIRQVLKGRCGITGCDGGAAARAAQKRAVREAKLERKCFEKHGMSREEYSRINNSFMHRGLRPSYFFVQQRRNAATRGISWELTFGQWWSIWEQSGKWTERGRGADLYVMSRPGDEGPYSVDNVVIKTLRENSREQFEWNNFGGKRPSLGSSLKDRSPEVLELIELRKTAVFGPSRIERIFGLPRGTFNNIVRAKSVRPDRYQAFRAGFLGLLKAA